LLREPSESWRLIHEPSGRAIVHHLLTAFDSRSRRTGLLRHERLDPNTALVIAPCNSIHTFFMRFTIDVAFMAKDGRVVKVRRALRPWRLAAAMRAHSVIELADGALDDPAVHVGDRFFLERRA
jgi:uncharacterized membrane protein (UPF0127 family)